MIRALYLAGRFAEGITYDTATHGQVELLNAVADAVEIAGGRRIG